MADIIISEFMDESAARSILKGWNLLFDPSLGQDPERLIQEVGPAQGLIVRNQTQVDDKLLAAAPKLRVVGRLGVGLDNIDLEACRARGIDVCPARGANDQAVAEYVITAALILLRGAYHSSAEVAEGAWPRAALIGRELAGKRLGLVGFGAIARAVAERAQALGMTVAAADPFVPPDDPAWRLAPRLDLAALLGCSQVVSLHLPMTEESRHLIDTGRLAQMTKGAILINTARGGILDETALAAALKTGHLGGAALDVFEEEPLGGAAGARLAALENVILTPHIAGVTEESNRRVSQVTAENVKRVLEATP